MKNYEPLFLKYRPQKLDELIGQNSIRDTLKTAIENHKLVHAYLLTGPRGSGKTSTARIFAKSLNCTGENNEINEATSNPCGKCPSCTSIADSTSLDVVEIDAASHGHVDDARSLIERVNYSSISGRYKIFIIDEVHMLTNAAFNALLKLFEEPPENVIFILATTEEDKVLPTITSRCQKFNFKRISVEDCSQRLEEVAKKENIQISKEAIEFIAKKSDGAMRDALASLDQLGVFDEEITLPKALEILGFLSYDDLNMLSKAILERDIEKTLSKLDELISNGKEAINISRELNNHLLEALETMGADSSNEDLASYEPFELVQMIDRLSELEFQLKQSNQAKNLLKACLVKLCHRADILLMRELKNKLEELESGGQLSPSNTASVKVKPVITTQNAAQRPMKNSSHSAPSFSQTPEKSKPEQENKIEPSVSKETPQEAGSNIAETKATEETREAPVSTSTEGTEEFKQYLSPACKGLFISSQAQFIGVESQVAKFAIPTRFKFLKSKLEAKADELKSALEKNLADRIDGLEISIQDLEIKEETPTANSKTSPAMEKSSEPQTEMATSTESFETPSTEDDPVQTEEMPTESFDEKEVEEQASPAKSHKLEEVSKMAENLFAGKTLN